MRQFINRLDPPSLEWSDNGHLLSIPYDDIYFSPQDPIGESSYVFLEGNQLPKEWHNKAHYTLIETGFGSGLNFLLTRQLWQQTKTANQSLHYISFEKHPFTKEMIAKNLKQFPMLIPLAKDLLESYPHAVSGYHHRYYAHDNLSLTLIFGDILTMLPQLIAQANGWYLDGFAPVKNPDMWQEFLFAHLTRCSHPDTSLASFTVASTVRKPLEKHGYIITKKPGFGKKREMLTARYQPNGTENITAVKNPLAPWYRLPKYTDKKDVIIIGGGVAGTSLAWHLAKKGCHSTLIEQHPKLTLEASGNPAGMVMPHLLPTNERLSPLFYAAFDYASHHYNQLADNNNSLILQHGALELLPREKTEHSKRPSRTIPDWTPLEIAEKVDNHQASDIAGISLQASGHYLKQALLLSPTSLGNHYHTDIENDCTLILTKHAFQIIHKEEEWHVISKEGNLIASAPKLVLANAYQTKSFAPTAWLPLRSIRGQLTYMPTSSMTAQLQVPLHYGGYITPAVGNEHIIGATFETENNNPSCIQESHQENLQQLASIIDLNHFDYNRSSLEGRVAFRAALPDRRPCVGPAPDYDAYHEIYKELHHGKSHDYYSDAPYHNGLYLFCGFGSRGLTTIPYMASILSAIITNTPIPLPADQLPLIHPARFLVRKLGRK